jgi:citrate synthase
MTTDSPSYSPGLEGVPICESALSLVEGEAGRLTYRGYSIEDLTLPEATFEQTVALLFDGELPNESRLSEMKDILRQNRNLDPEIVELIRQIAKKTHPMFAMQAGIAMLGPKDNDFEIKVGSIRQRSLSLVAKVATVVGVIAQSLEDRPYQGPRDSESHAEMLLRMITGNETHPDGHVHTMDSLLTLQADHSAGNASTFTSRVVTSTKAEPEAVVSSAIGALSGPAHGGANEASLRLFIEIGDPDNAEQEIGKKLDDKFKIPGFGHRVYSVKDPRSKVIQRIADQIIQPGSKNDDYYKIALSVESVATERLGDRGLFPNVDLFSGCVFAAIGIPIDLFTPIFVAGRTLGWVANMEEQWESGNRIYRPTQIYTGEAHRPYSNIAQRD